MVRTIAVTGTGEAMNAIQRKVILEALKRYRTAKLAEGKLTSQRQKDKASIEAAFVPFQRLLDVIDSTIAHVEKGTA